MELCVDLSAARKYNEFVSLCLHRQLNKDVLIMQDFRLSRRLANDTSRGKIGRMIMNNLNMCINFGFVGFQNSDPPKAACKKISELMKEFLDCAQSYNDSSYGFSGNKIRCNIYSGDIFCTEAIHRIARQVGCKTNVVTSAYRTDGETIQADAVVALDVKKQNLSYPNILAEYVVNKSDAVFLLWDGRQNFQEGILWMVLQFCKHKNVPYYLVNTEKLEEVSFSSDSYYTPYSSENVKSYVASLYDYKETVTKDEPIPLSDLWQVFHDRFIKKYKLKAKSVPYVEDKLLSGSLLAEVDGNARNYAMLTEYFSYYDQKAIEASAMYRASIYFRSILPMLTTIFIAIGFYAETLLTFLLGEYKLLFGLNCWVVLAGVGFLIHALLNRYAGQIAKNPRVERFRKDFLEARFIAEYLRVAIHSEIYAIQINNVSMKDSLVDKHVLAKLHHIIRQQEPVSYVQSKESIDEAIKNFEALIADQKAYHENCINRYELITQRLDKMASMLYVAGFAIVIARGFLQFIVPFAASGLKLSATIHGVKVESFIKSFANMLALVMPAWASYFSTKLNMNGYAWQRNNSIKMKAGFDAIEAKLSGIKQQKSNSYQVICDIANDVMDLTREDFTGWYLHTESHSFTRL